MDSKKKIYIVLKPGRQQNFERFDCANMMLEGQWEYDSDTGGRVYTGEAPCLFIFSFFSAFHRQKLISLKTHGEIRFQG